MNPLAKLSLYVAGVVLLAALLSPPIYWLLHPVLGDVPFRRVFSRTALVAALALLWPLLRWMEIRDFSQLGLVRNPRRWRHLIAGLFIAAVPLALLAVFYFWADIWRIRKDIEWNRVPAIIATAAAVPVVEEFLFRGVLLGLTVRAFGRAVGLVGVSVVFAAVHFIDSRYNVADVQWGSGFEVLGHAFSNSGGFILALFGGLALYVLGVIFAFATLRTRSLWLAIGLHAGCILGAQVLNLVAKFRLKPFDLWLPWAGPNVVHGMVPTGVAPLAALLVMGVLVCWYLKREPGPSAVHSARDAG